MLKSVVVEGITLSTADQQRKNWKVLLLSVRGLTKVHEVPGRKFPRRKEKLNKIHSQKISDVSAEILTLRLPPESPEHYRYAKLLRTA